MESGFLLSIAIILFATKIFGELAEKFKLPQVVGALVAGVIIGPSVTGLVHSDEFLNHIAQIGVIFLMFLAGLDTDLGELKRKGASYLLIALFGVFIPLIGGFLSYAWFFHINPGQETDILKALFIGVVLTATSVSITIEALRELGHLNSRIGNAILGAAIVDDILGIIILTFITSLRDPNVSIWAVVIKIVLYFIVLTVAGILTGFGAKFLNDQKNRKRITVYAIAIVILIAFISEEFVGIADITGAYIVGIIFSRFAIRENLVKKVETMGYLFFSPIFFASIGLKTVFNNFTMDLVMFSIVLTIVAILTKVYGAGAGARLCKYTKHESLNIGIGMVSRGEVALIVAQKGYNVGLIDEKLFSPVILMVVITTIFAPILLKKTIEPKDKNGSKREGPRSSVNVDGTWEEVPKKIDYDL